MTTSTQPPAGWYPDPAGSGDERYWDGGGWSQVTRPRRDGAAPDVVDAGAGAAPVAGVLASWGSRVLAAILDAILLMLPTNILTSLIMGDANVRLQEWSMAQLDRLQRGEVSGSPWPPADLMGPLLLAVLAGAVLFVIYRTVMVARRGSTIGQTILGMRVANADDPVGNVSWGTSALRASLGVLFGYIGGLNVVNALLPLFNQKMQTLHDMLAKTVVLKK